MKDLRRHILMAAFLAALTYSCGPVEEVESGGRTRTDALGGGGRASGDQSGRTMDGADTESDAGSVDGVSGEGSLDPSDGDDVGDSDDPQTGPGPAAGETGEGFFTRAVLPVLSARCGSCHADPRIPVTVRAPLSIYSYSSMRAKLANGVSKASNELLDKVRGIASHGGGNRCDGGLQATPCREIQDWWEKELGDSGSAPEVAAGRVTEVTSLGRIYGYAVDPSDTAASVTVSFFVDGPKGTGTEAGSVLADRAGRDGNSAGDHAFFAELPESARNGRPRTLFAYAEIDGQSVLLGGSSTTYTAYSFTAAGRAYYDANVRPQLGGCQGCHTISYEQQFYSLIAPSPAQGATATNNQLINKPSQTNNTAHGGGQRCGSVNAAPCAQIQEWWRREFQAGAAAIP